MTSSQAALGDAPDTIGQAVDREIPVANAMLRDDTRLSGLYHHDAVHGHLPAMRDHVIITYHGEPQDMVWRLGNQRLAGCSHPGSLTIIPEGHEGRWDIFGPISVSQVFLPHRRLVSCAEEMCRGNIELLGRVGFQDPIAAQILRLLGRNPHAVAEPAARLLVEHATDMLVERLLGAHCSTGQAARVSRAGLAAWQVRKVTSYMRDHIEEPIGLDVLAEKLGLSRFHFCTAFRKATGRTPHAWLVNLRMERAQELLANCELPVTEVALAVGYESPSSFAAAFRKVKGLAPRDFRRLL